MHIGHPFYQLEPIESQCRPILLSNIGVAQATRKNFLPSRLGHCTVCVGRSMLMVMHGRWSAACISTPRTDMPDIQSHSSSCYCIPGFGLLHLLCSRVLNVLCIHNTAPHMNTDCHILRRIRNYSILVEVWKITGFEIPWRKSRAFQCLFSYSLENIRVCLWNVSLREAFRLNGNTSFLQAPTPGSLNCKYFYLDANLIVHILSAN